jgi:hypothetical protein
LRITRRQQLQLNLPGNFKLPFEPLLFNQLLVQHHLFNDDRDL